MSTPKARGIIEWHRIGWLMPNCTIHAPLCGYFPRNSSKFHSHRYESSAEYV